jgi:hypothetical protein
MKLIIYVELLIILIVFFVVNLMKHWQLLIMPDILLGIDASIQRQDIWFYTLVSYLGFFYGNLAGQLLWHWTTEWVSTTTALFLSLVFMGLFSYLQGLATSLQSFIFLRFLLGLSMNLEKSGKAFIHEKIAKVNRQPAFFVDSAAYTMGTLSGPLVGLTIYHFSLDFSDACKIVAMLLAFCAILHFSLFSMVQREEVAPSMVRLNSLDEERIPFLSRGSILHLNWRNALIHVFWDNRVSRSLVIIALVNAMAFHLTLVLTTLYLFDKNDASHHRLDQYTVAEGNLLGGLASLVTIAYVGQAVKRPSFYLTYMYITICINAASTMIMPFFKQIVVLFPVNEDYLVWGFIIFKEACCYYLYSQILSYLISVSIFKLYRKPFNFVLTVVRSFLYAACFNIALPLLYLGKILGPDPNASQHAYVLIFWLIALCQLMTLSQFKFVDIVLDRSNMID